ncbi:MAG: FKBP-type peptidyl-prolyl cis-trans isomerase [Butyribacter sp.]|nr:FKBP-type peptidyl-prolyl cis-trans isomerase [bacterium]MDY3853486.1 FKBP-type peptidyl-prolyl cis-trans isomerase [Butyribacter sp.]
MKKKWLMLSLCSCLAVASMTGCGAADKAKKTVNMEKESTPLIQNAKSYIELADYSVIELDKDEIDKELQEGIDQTLDEYATYKHVKKGTVKDGDTVNIFYVGKIDGVAFDGGSCTKENTPDGYDLEIGSNTFIDGFEEGLIGKKIGKTYDIDVTFPDNYSANEELSGKKAVFTVTINYKQGKKVKQEFTDDFVKKNLTTYTSVEDYMTQNRATIIQSKAVAKVCNDTKIKKYPEDKVKEMETQLKTSIEAYLAQNSMTLDDYLTNLNTSKEDYEKQVKETAQEDVGNQLVYNAIAQAENITISDDEYKEELKTYLTNYNCEKESDLNKQFKETYGTTAKQIIYNDLLYQKVADYLVKNVKES